jgi:hypothetical protein
MVLNCHLMPGKVKVTIPYGQLEYTAFFRQPIFEAFAEAPLTTAIMAVLEPYGFSIEGLEYKDHAEKATEQYVLFRRTTPPGPPTHTLTLALNRFVVAAENLDWSEANGFITGIRAVTDAIMRVAHAELKSHQVALGIHVQLSEREPREILMPLLSADGLRILQGDAKVPAMFLNFQGGSIYLDGSAGFANALFVRIFREHVDTVRLEELAEILYRDERRVFDVLGLEGEL